ncbi:hypothetical protein ACIHJG_38445 [Streptomyces sp. NPDC052415]|uniref:hypothetical protein n=1 Tax=Streptomyces sp. NPDC052415 TaxID=3365690 RepID=UPI0037D7CE0C
MPVAISLGACPPVRGPVPGPAKEHAPDYRSNWPAKTPSSGLPKGQELPGKVSRLPFQSLRAYFSPGHGQVHEAAFTRISHGGEEKRQTAGRRITVDAATGKESSPATLAGGVTSAIPANAGMVAASSAARWTGRHP